MKAAVWGFLLGVGIGGAIGWRALAGGEVVSEARPSQPSTDVSLRNARGERGVLTADEIHRTFLERTALLVKPGELTLKEAVAGWSDDQIRAALEAGLRDPEAVVLFGPGVEVAKALLKEWIQRDRAAALVWLEQAAPRTASQRMCSLAAEVWPIEHAEELVAFACEHKDIFVALSGRELCAKGLSASVRRGPQALEKMIGLLQENGYWIQAMETAEPFPADFDFPAFASSESMRKIVAESPVLLRQWLKRDPDQAFTFLRENENLTSFTLLWFESSNSRKHDGWFAAKFESQDEVTRASLMEAIRSNARQDTGGTEGLLDFCQKVKEPSVQRELQQMSLSHLLNGRASVAMSFLETIEEPSKRIEMLETADWEKLHPGTPGFYREDEPVLRKALLKWNATPAQQDAIVARLLQTSQPSPVAQ